MFTDTLTRRVVSITLACLFVAVPLMAQPYQERESDGGYAQGQADGQRDAQGSFLWAVGGFCCGCWGILGAFLISPGSPPAQNIVGKSSDYVRGYSDGWSKKTKEKNAIYAGVGCCVQSVISVVVQLIFNFVDLGY